MNRFGRENPDYSKSWSGNLKTWIARKNENWNGIFGNIHVDFCFFFLDASIFMSLAPWWDLYLDIIWQCHTHFCCSHFLKDDIKNRGGLELPTWFLLGFLAQKSAEATKKPVVFHQPPKLHFLRVLDHHFRQVKNTFIDVPRLLGWGQNASNPLGSMGPMDILATWNAWFFVGLNVGNTTHGLYGNGVVLRTIREAHRIWFAKALTACSWRSSPLSSP